MIEEGSAELTARINLDTVRHADLKVSILNAPHSHRSDEKLWTIADFIDTELADELNKRTKGQSRKKDSKKEQSSKWSSAGNAWVSQFDGRK